MRSANGETTSKQEAHKLKVFIIDYLTQIWGMSHGKTVSYKNLGKNIIIHLVTNNDFVLCTFDRKI